MKQILIELDDRCARDLERVAPAKDRKRAEFIRLALRRAIDLALDRATRDAYLARPLDEPAASADLEGWDAGNALARPAQRLQSAKRRPTSAA
jgi:predicted transcriptional regulator